MEIAITPSVVVARAESRIEESDYCFVTATTASILLIGAKPVFIKANKLKMASQVRQLLELKLPQELLQSLPLKLPRKPPLKPQFKV